MWSGVPSAGIRMAWMVGPASCFPLSFSVRFSAGTVLLSYGQSDSSFGWDGVPSESEVILKIVNLL